MLNRLFGLLLMLSAISNSSLSATNYTHNYQFDIKAHCYEADNGSSDPNCYPIWYENSDGSSNIFANYVAVLNCLSPIISLSSIKLSHYLVNRWNGQIDKAVEHELKSFKTAEVQIRMLLSRIIQEFDNGINDTHDYTLALGVIERLNMQKCQGCINEFADIVSQQFPPILEIIPIDNNDGADLTTESDNLFLPSDDGRSDNKKRFYRFADNISSPERIVCDLHRDSPIILKDVSEKGVAGKCASALFSNWNHPFHLSSLAYTAFTMIAPPCFSMLVDVNNRAGSLIGDVANISNAIVIPTVQMVNIWQNWMNHDRKLAQKLLSELECRLEGIHGILEIAAQVIGKMENNISVAQARGYLKALVLIGWPDDLVTQFMLLAANQDNDFATFTSNLKSAFESKKTPYNDDDIDGALDGDIAVIVVDDVSL